MKSRAPKSHSQKAISSQGLEWKQEGEHRDIETVTQSSASILRREKSKLLVVERDKPLVFPRCAMHFSQLVENIMWSDV